MRLEEALAFCSCIALEGSDHTRTLPVMVLLPALLDCRLRSALLPCCLAARTQLPPEIGACTALTWLSLNANQLRVLPPSLGRLTNLIRL